MASSEKKRRALAWLSKNNLVAILISGIIGVFAPNWAPVGNIIANQAEQAVDQRVEEHCDKHGGCE